MSRAGYVPDFLSHRESRRCHLVKHKHDHNDVYTPEDTGMTCLGCLRPVYCDESYAKTGRGVFHVRCLSGPRERPEFLPRPARRKDGKQRIDSRRVW